MAMQKLCVGRQTVGPTVFRRKKLSNSSGQFAKFAGFGCRGIPGARLITSV